LGGGGAISPYFALRDVILSGFSSQVRRLAVLARTGQPWDENLPGRVGQEYRGWLEVAQHSARPDLILDRLASYCEEAELLRLRVGRALVYPRLVLLGLMFQLVALAILVQWIAPGVWLPLALLGIGALSAWSRHRMAGNARLAWGLVGSRVRSRVDQVLWCGNLSHLLAMELDLPTAVAWAARATRDPLTRAQAAALEEPLRQGSTLSQALQGGDWDPLLGWAAEAGERHAALPQALREAAQCLEDNLRDELTLVMAWLQPATLAVAGSLVMITMVLFWLSYQNAALAAGA